MPGARFFAALPAFAAAVWLTAAPSDPPPPAPPPLPPADRVRIAETFRLDRERRCWKNAYFSKPFSLSPAFDAADCGARPGGRG